jgi:arginyl-tRNA synthetase
VFYQKNPILKADPDQKYIRLMITKAVGSIIVDGLGLLGIKTVEKM